jgi:hypothetical protein
MPDMPKPKYTCQSDRFHPKNNCGRKTATMGNMEYFVNVTSLKGAFVPVDKLLLPLDMSAVEMMIV